MQEFLAAEPPRFALGMVEERQRLCGMLALRLDKETPTALADGGFQFGHALLGPTACAVLYLVCAFPGFQIYNVLINPNNPLAQAVVTTMLDDGDYFLFALNARCAADGCSRGEDPRAMVVDTDSQEGVWITGGLRHPG
jgi:hypothetical protein